MALIAQIQRAIASIKMNDDTPMRIWLTPDDYIQWRHEVDLQMLTPDTLMRRWRFMGCILDVCPFDQPSRIVGKATTEMLPDG